MASEKQKVARSINWELARVKCCRNIASKVLYLTGDKELYMKWLNIISTSEKKLKGAYL